MVLPSRIPYTASGGSRTPAGHPRRIIVVPPGHDTVSGTSEPSTALWRSAITDLASWVTTGVKPAS
jgi:hypothetical protein